jgi:hypothetical protein
MEENLDLFGNPILDSKRTMSDYFGVAPFSIINTVDGEWQRRKKRWNILINDYGQERKNVLGGSDNEKDVMNNMNGTSILDACLAEIIIKWFTEDNFKTFDPFAGDTVFGFVSSWFNRPFTGIELRPEQAKFNQIQCNRENLNAKYICDNSENMDKYIEDNSMDFIFSCPPYFDLEIYSDLKEDLSNMNQDDFFKMYNKILTNTFKKLKDNRFAVIVTSEVRDKKSGEYILLVPHTIGIMKRAGYKFYNDLILVNSVGTLPLRAGKFMNSGRKVGRRHQNILVFYKGDPKKIKENFKELIPKNEYYEQ